MEITLLRYNTKILEGYSSRLPSKPPKLDPGLERFCIQSDTPFELEIAYF